MTVPTNLVFDIEGDGLLEDITQIHMIVTRDINTAEVMVYHDHGLDYLRNNDLLAGIHALEEADLLAGHNIIEFDIEVIKKIWPNYKPKESQKLVDSLTMSRLMFPGRFVHSLESWAKTLKMDQQKIQNEDWSTISQNMLDRCIADVEINYELLMHFKERITQHTKEGSNWYDPLLMEQDIQHLHVEQVKTGVRYDVELAKKTLLEFDPKLKSLRDKICKGVGDKIDPPQLTRPKMVAFSEDTSDGFPGVKKPFKKDGTPTAISEKWFKNWLVWRKSLFAGNAIETLKGPYCKISYRPFNPDSDPEIKEYLYTLGWKPDEWNVKKVDKDYKKMSPKLSESSFGSLPPGLGKTIQEYRTLKHRRGLIQSPKNPETAGALCKVRKDGRVSAHAVTLGTPTARYRHSGAVCNIPRPSSDYGEEIRRLYGVDPENWQVGVDLSGIEARFLAHLCYDFTDGKNFAELVTTGDWHSRNADLWKCSRDDAKTELYALMFSAGPTKLGNILGRSVAQGRKNKNDFMRAYPAYAEAETYLTGQMQFNQGWIPAIDGRRLYVRTKKDVLNTYTQGNAAILFKYWIIQISKVIKKWSQGITIKQLLLYHDEGQWEVHSDIKDDAIQFGKRCERLAIEAGQHFNLNVKIEAESKTGKSWSECH